jgi:hypothetical protein
MTAIHGRYDCCSLQIRDCYLIIIWMLFFSNMIVVDCIYDCFYRIVAYSVYICWFYRYDSVIYYIYYCCVLPIWLLYTPSDDCCLFQTRKGNHIQWQLLIKWMVCMFILRLKYIFNHCSDHSLVTPWTVDIKGVTNE